MHKPAICRKEPIWTEVTIPLRTSASASTLALAGARQDAKVSMPSDPAALEIWEDWGFSDAIVTGDANADAGLGLPKRRSQFEANIDCRAKDG